MKLSILIAATTAALVSAKPPKGQYGASNPHRWIPGGPNDCEFVHFVEK